MARCGAVCFRFVLKFVDSLARKALAIGILRVERRHRRAAFNSATVAPFSADKPLGDGHCYGVTDQKGDAPTYDRYGEPGELLEVYDGDQQLRVLHRSCIN